MSGAQDARRLRAQMRSVALSLGNEGGKPRRVAFISGGIAGTRTLSQAGHTFPAAPNKAKPMQPVFASAPEMTQEQVERQTAAINKRAEELERQVKEMQKKLARAEELDLAARRLNDAALKKREAEKTLRSTQEEAAKAARDAGAFAAALKQYAKQNRCSLDQAFHALRHAGTPKTF